MWEKNNASSARHDVATPPKKPGEEYNTIKKKKKFKRLQCVSFSRHTLICMYGKALV